MTPFKLTPAFKDYLWGGERLKTDFSMETDCTPLAESWSLSSHPDGESVVSTGAHRGEPFSALAESADIGQRSALLGKNCGRFDSFPILIKLIDAAKPLSIQVHPDDAYAKEHENSFGKTEMWYILDAAPDSFLYYGVSRQTTPEEMRQAIQEGRLEDLMGRRPVKAGDVAFIPAGRMHAIGAGIVLCEVQQNSNVTYRVYDYNRRGADGKLRQLHADQALAVADLTPVADDFAPQGPRKAFGQAADTLLVLCDIFEVHAVDVDGSCSARTAGATFHSWLCVEGEGKLECGGECWTFKKGESLFIPADAGTYTVKGRCRCVVSGIPAPGTDMGFAVE